MNDDVFYAEIQIRSFEYSKSEYNKKKATTAIAVVADDAERKALQQLLEWVEKEPSSYVGD